MFCAIYSRCFRGLVGFPLIPEIIPLPNRPRRSLGVGNLSDRSVRYQGLECTVTYSNPLPRIEMSMDFIRLQQGHTGISPILFTLCILIFFCLLRPWRMCWLLLVFGNLGAGRGRLGLLLVLFLDGRILRLQSHLLSTLVAAGCKY